VGSPVASAVKRLILHPRIWRVLDRPRFFYGVRYLLVGGQQKTKRLLREHLSLLAEERVLDVCCGVGEFADVVETDYVGIDLNPRFIERARRRFGESSRRKFEVGDVTKLPYPSRHFDKTIIVNSLHHFSDDAALALLTEVRRVTRCLVVVVDADGTPRGLVRRALVAMDRGRFMRSPEALAAVVGRVMPIERRARFDVGLYTEVLLHCPVPE
jgi:ubiquinone/menaquinone biosynthesis C-methylase UbiE